jgi:hypothetical protein
MSDKEVQNDLKKYKEWYTEEVYDNRKGDILGHALEE